MVAGHVATGEYIGRFAPSPTGPLHFGSLVAALASYLDAKAHGGRWLLRIEDVDETRCRSEFADNILQTLRAFGLEWDGAVLVQSLRKARYELALSRLSDAGHTYACSCSRREIADSATLGLDGPVYPGSCRALGLSPADNAIRILTNNAPLQFVDRLQGEFEQRLESQLGDFIIKRRDGLFAYQLAVVVDDGDQGVSHIVRGADLIDSTTRQIHLQRLLGLPTPQYLHIPVATNTAGQKLSKRTLAPGISAVDAHALLGRALEFLGQPLPNSPSIPALLAAATRNWTVSAIPALLQRQFP